MRNSKCYARKVTIHGGVKLARFGVILDINSVELLIILWHSVLIFRGDFSSIYGVLELREARQYLYLRLRSRSRVPLVALLVRLLDSLPCFLHASIALLVEDSRNLVAFVDDNIGKVLESRLESLGVVADRERHGNGHA